MKTELHECNHFDLSNVREHQTRRFTDTLTCILPDHIDCPKVSFESGLVTAASLLVHTPLNTEQIIHLCHFAESWAQNIQIKAMAYGVLLIEFQIKN